MRIRTCKYFSRSHCTANPPHGTHLQRRTQPQSLSPKFADGVGDSAPRACILFSRGNRCNIGSFPTQFHGLLFRDEPSSPELTYSYRILRGWARKRWTRARLHRFFRPGQFTLSRRNSCPSSMRYVSSFLALVPTEISDPVGSLHSRYPSGGVLSTHASPMSPTARVHSHRS